MTDARRIAFGVATISSGVVAWLLLRHRRHRKILTSYHPLDPLSVEELEAAVKGVYAATNFNADDQHIVSVHLMEPSKQVVRSWQPGNVRERAARVVVWNRSAAMVSEAVINVSSSGEVQSWTDHPGAKSQVVGTESDAVTKAVRNDPRVIESLRARGISAPEEVVMEAWSFGSPVPPGIDDCGARRLVWTPMYHRPTPTANHYAHPIPGLFAIADLDTSEVLAVEDDAAGVATPGTPGPYRAADSGAHVVLQPLRITQPEGASFKLDGWHLSWERWRLRVGFCQREGLLIHDVRFDDGGTERRIAHRMSIAELAIPYGDGTPAAHRKQAFDTGEYGLGNFTNSLTLGCDCLGEIGYLDVAVVRPDGSIKVIPNAICIHEEDSGVLWKHTDNLGHVEVRRGRRLVVSTMVTVGNYEYGYNWYFKQDGAIEFEAKLTGIVLTVAGMPGVPQQSATELEPGLFAPYHQHILCARLDLEVDGETNTVVEVDSVAHPLGPRNPFGAAYETVETPLLSEATAKRMGNPLAGRHWKVQNPSRRNHLGMPVAYKLLPGQTTVPMALETESIIGRRAGFMYHHLCTLPTVSLNQRLVSLLCEPTLLPDPPSIPPCREPLAGFVSRTFCSDRGDSTCAERAVPSRRLPAAAPRRSRASRVDTCGPCT